MSKEVTIEIDTQFNDGGIIVSIGSEHFLVNLKPGQEFGINVDGRRIHTFGANELAEAVEEK